MTRSPFVTGKAADAFSRQKEMFDTTMGRRFINPALEAQYGVDSMPETAENVAHDFQISREDQDLFAWRSQQRAKTAQESKVFAREISPIEVKKNVTAISVDENPRRDTTPDGLAKLEAPFRMEGCSVTAGNASGINDGAGALILASEVAVRKHGLKPRVRVVSVVSAGVPPRIMGIGPVFAVRKLLEKNRLIVSDIDVFELNEAFASQILAVLRQFGLPDDAKHVNPHGGAIALGHPLGMSSARLAMICVNAMETVAVTGRRHHVHWRWTGDSCPDRASIKMDALSGPVRISRHGAVAVIHVRHEEVNALSRAVRMGLLDAMKALDVDTDVAAIVISGGAGRFLAGADLREMNLPPTEPFLPDVVACIEAVHKPVVAALDCPALGGGFEVALACDVRVGSANATLGLPETRLGLTPGAGGTQRLPRLVGVAKAIELICAGRILKAAEALDLGLIDLLCEQDVLDAVRAAIGQVKRPVSAMPIPGSDPGPEEQAERTALKSAKGVPAIAEAIKVIHAAQVNTFVEGLAAERAAFLRLRQSEEAQALLHLFSAEREATKVPGLGGVEARPFSRTAVIGAGTMGAGIAVVFADAGLSVVLIERDAEASAAGLERLHGIYARQVQRGRITQRSADERLARIITSCDWSTLADVSLAVEAAFEDFAMKVDIFQCLAEIMPKGAILASNTSYLDLNALAAKTQRSQDVIGLHFFSPPNIMKLLEIVRARQTAVDVMATALALAKKIGKQPVVAEVCDGVIGNRIYAAYRRHAEYLVEDGATPEQVDAALEAYGFAMGIFAVSYVSGLDIAFAMRKRRATTRDPRERYVGIADRLCEAGRLGRKSDAGWYSYDPSGIRHVDPVTEKIILNERRAKRIVPYSFTPKEVQRRLVAVTANEGAKVLADGIAIRASDIDLVFVNGYGFPRLKGGPMWAADREGLPQILAGVEAAYATGGVGSEPAPLLNLLSWCDKGRLSLRGAVSKHL
jgi:3-hydroxyacyl-CoA dehydrogenase